MGKLIYDAIRFLIAFVAILSFYTYVATLIQEYYQFSTEVLILTFIILYITHNITRAFLLSWSKDITRLNMKNQKEQ